MDLLDLIGKRIKAERVRQRLTLNDVAQLSCVAPSTILRYEEKGKSEMSVRRLVRIAGALGLSLDRLVSEEEEE